jgi:response regulator RpfG family c-di-GMP phosphodiesterase
VTEKILLVDDEVLLLDSLRRELGFKYSIETAQSGSEALEMIGKNGPYAVIVSDYRMPVMDGIEFLAKAKEITPDSVRMMLTGNTDLLTAIEAINQGQIFRYLPKPCSGEQLSSILDAGIRQYQLVTAEKDLLEKTLKESISMLTEVLAIVNNEAYGRSLRIQQLVAHIVKVLNLKDGWQYEMAAALSQLGWIIFPQEMLEKINNGLFLDAAETVIFSKHPFTASKLIEKIPRLEMVSRMIAGQNRSIDDLCLNPAYPDIYPVDLGSHILKICVDYDQLTLQGLLHDQILAALRSKKSTYDPQILSTLSSLQSAQALPENRTSSAVSQEDLEIGMLLVEPIKDIKGNIVVKENTNISRSVLIEILKLGAQPNYLVEPFKVARKKDW